MCFKHQTWWWRYIETKPQKRTFEKFIETCFGTSVQSLFYHCCSHHIFLFHPPHSLSPTVYFYSIFFCTFKNSNNRIRTSNKRCYGLNDMDSFAIQYVHYVQYEQWIKVSETKNCFINIHSSIHIMFYIMNFQFGTL